MPLLRSRKTKYLMQYLLTWLLLQSGKVLPYEVRIKSGGALLGYLITHLKTPRERIDNNLKLVFPEMPIDKRRDIAKGIGRNFGKTFVEILNNDASQNHPEYRHASGEGLQTILDAHAKGRGAIIVSGHFGHWDAARLYLKSQGVNVGAVYRPSNNTYFDRLFVPQIEVAGSPAFSSRRKGTLEMVRHVRAGGMVAILLDQHFQAGEPLDFMGQPAMTSTAAANMALKYGVPMVPVYGTRRDSGLHVDITFEAAIAHSDAITMTQQANDSLTARATANPDQWYWLHNRWA